MVHSWFKVNFVENQFEGQGPEEEEAGSEESENHPEHRREHLDKRCPEIRGGSDLTPSQRVGRGLGLFTK
jgi:hypothetical protein